MITYDSSKSICFSTSGITKSTISRNLNGDIFNLLRLDFINVHTFYKLDPIY